jgi:phage terminase small subunit
MPMPSKSNERKALAGSKPGNDLKPGTPAKPSGLSESASAEWDRLAAELEAAGLQLTVAHRAAMSVAATIAADLKADWSEIQKDGAYDRNLKTGVLVAHPAVKRMDALRRDYIKVLGLLGLRAAVSGGNQDEGDELSAILND